MSQPSKWYKLISEEKLIRKQNENEKLPFAKNEVYRLMKENLDDDKRIRERVKLEMNRFLGEILKKRM